MLGRGGRALATCTHHHRPLLGRPDSSQSAYPRTSMSSCLSGRPVRKQIQPTAPHSLIPPPHSLTQANHPSSQPLTPSSHPGQSPSLPHPTPHPGQTPLIPAPHSLTQANHPHPSPSLPHPTPHPHANDAEPDCLLDGVLPHLPVYLVLRSTVVPDATAQLQVHHTRLAKLGGNVFQAHVCC